MIKFIFFIYLVRLSVGEQDYDPYVHRVASELPQKDGVKMHMFDRISLLSRQIYEDAVRRVRDINEMRFMYEETLEYESGYIMGEIIERYRKLMEEGRMAYVNLHEKYQAHRHAAADLLNRVEKAQHLYFELFQLVQMMHEIIPKYQEFTKKDKKTTPMRIYFPEDSMSTQKKYDHDKEAKKRKERAEKREQERREKMEMFKQTILEKMKDREFMQNKLKYSHYSYELVHDHTKKATTKKIFPFDYGWGTGSFNV